MKEKIRLFIDRILTDYLKGKDLVSNIPEVTIEVPRVESFGDYSTNIALQIAKLIKKTSSDTSKEISEMIMAEDDGTLFARVEGTKNGFINIILSDNVLNEAALTARKSDRNYGRQDIGRKEKLLIEYVSANPTGPLHVGHGRWAVIGDVLSRLFKITGYKVDSEFYINDIGNQIDLLVRSVEARIKGETLPEGGYGGHYIYDIANKFKGKKADGDKMLDLILREQKETLDTLRVHFDRWFKESSLHKDKKIAKAIRMLEGRGLIFLEKGAKWFRSTNFGDDKDRVLEKEGGAPTYFASDIAYHLDKFKRKYDRLLNVWGTDHHGYVSRLKSAMGALGYPKDKLEIIIGQLVMLYRGKEQVRMSKRTGEMVTLREVIDEIGVDATRYFLARTSPNTHLEFDLELAKTRSNENPVYYVQYAHARICSILKEAMKSGFNLKGKSDLRLLKDPSERKLLIRIMRYPEDVADATAFRQPHKMTAFAEEIATIFHNFYHRCRVVSSDKELSKARITLVDAARIVVRNVLELLGVSAPEHM